MRTVRFRVHQGHLEPLEPVAMVEGTELEVALPVPESKPSTIGALLEIVERQHRIDPALIDELNRSIESGKLPVRSEGVFDHERK